MWACGHASVTTVLEICLASLDKSSSFRFSGTPGVTITSAVIIIAITWKAIEDNA